MFSIFTCVMSRVTHSEPGLPMLGYLLIRGSLFCELFCGEQGITLKFYLKRLYFQDLQSSVKFYCYLYVSFFPRVVAFQSVQ